MIRPVHTFFFHFVFNCLAAIKDMIRRVRSARAESPYKQHALKGQKLLAQGSALVIMSANLSPCKGKSFTYRNGFSIFIRCILKLLPLQGALLTDIIPRALPWAKSFCPFRACCVLHHPYRSVFSYTIYIFSYAYNSSVQSL